MKKVIYLILTLAIFASCDSNKDVNSDNMNAINTDDRIDAAVPDTRVFIEILFTDSNNVSVFDPQGKNWVREDIYVAYPYISSLNGKNDTLYYRYDKEFIPRSPDITHILFTTRSAGKEDLWLGVAVNVYEPSELRKCFLHFPDNTVDTLLAQVEPVTSIIDKHFCIWHKIWYNGKLVLSTDLWGYSEEEIEALGRYPDGSKVYKSNEFQIIK